MGRRETGRGVVMSLNNGWAIVMSPDGEFRRLRARPAWRVGDDVLLVAEPTPVRRAMPWLASVGAAAAAAVVTFTVMSNAANNTPRWYVDITGTNEVKLAVSQTGRVLQAVSEDGQPLPVHIQPGEPVTQAVKVVALAVGAGPNSAGAVLINFYPAQGAKAPPEAGRTVEMAANAVDASCNCAQTASMMTHASSVAHVQHQGASHVHVTMHWALGRKPEQPV